jgi:phosphate transport system permease protein
MTSDSTGPAPSAAPAGPTSAKSRELGFRLTWGRTREVAIQFGLFLCAVLTTLVTLAIAAVLFVEAVAGPGGTAFFQQVSVVEFLTGTEWTPQYTEKKFGVLPLVCGTLQITVIAAMIGLPLGLLSAIYLSEYAAPRTRAIIKPALEILAGIPTVVYGYFALTFITPYVIKPLLQPAAVFKISWLWSIPVDGFNALSGGIVVGLMIVPLISSLSEDVLRAVPRTLREAGYALGSTKFDVCTKIVVPSALSGIFAAFLLAVSRAIGETMAVTIASGQKPTLTLNPLMQIETMTAYIVNVMSGDAAVGTIEYKSLYAVALVLFLVTLFMNWVSQMVLDRYREVYQ